VVYPKIVARWETEAYALLAFLRHPRPIRRYLYTRNQLERVTKEVKRRTKVVEVFCGETLWKDSILGFVSAGRGTGNAQAPRIGGNPELNVTANQRRNCVNKRHGSLPEAQFIRKGESCHAKNSS